MCWVIIHLPLLDELVVLSDYGFQRYLLALKGFTAYPDPNETGFSFSQRFL